MTKPILKVYALGDFKVEIGKSKLKLENWDSKKALKLFKYLLINYKKTCHMEKIIDRLWPDCSLTVSKSRLYDTVYRLRKIIDINNTDKSYIKKLPEGYSLNLKKNYWFDWSEFSSIYEKYKEEDINNFSRKEIEEIINELKYAINLYKGDFMPDDLYDDWIGSYRSYYREMLLDLIFTISELFNKISKNKEALGYLEYGIREEPFREEFYLLSMKILNEENRIWEKNLLYKKYKEIVEGELGILPSEAVQREYNRLKPKVLLSKNEIDIDDELEIINSEEDCVGALKCDFDTFKEIYKLKRSYVARTGNHCTLWRICFNEISNLEKFEKLLISLRKKLRSIDVISSCGSNIVILLHDASLEANLVISNRILNSISLAEIGVKPRLSWEEVPSYPINKKIIEEEKCNNSL